ncbi:MAG: glycosyltransferase family 2 protein [Pseudomonadota bacterium]
MGLSELVSLLLIAIGLALAVPVVVLCFEICCAYLLPARSWPSGRRPRVAVLVPAHNEEAVIKPTLAGIKAQLRDGDRLVVVADNCSDRTGEIAEAAGAEVVHRSDLARRGKSFALDFGLRHLEMDPPEIVIIVDADCELSEGALDQLAAVSAELDRPVQANYEMHLPVGSVQRSMRVAAFAWRIRNFVRPLGLQKLGLSCQLMGTGMAFPWALISKADLQSAEIVEDLALGLVLARDGKAPVFLPDTTVSSVFPASAEGQSSQRARWETGHLNAIVRYALPIVKDAMLFRTHRQAIVLAADNLVPPLSFFVLLLVAYFAVSGLLALVGGSALAVLVASINLALVAVSVIALGWWRSGRDVLPFDELMMAFGYTVGKIPLYLRVLGGRQLAWIRTKRD